MRLCDGSFFPLSGGRSSCESECPGAPAEVYYLAAGSDQIDGATSAKGERYQDLPVAFRYRTTVDKTCRCRGKGSEKNMAQLLQDPTLRNGDLVMTAGGIRVLRDAHHFPYTSGDFVEVGNSALPPGQRDLLAAMKP